MAKIPGTAVASPLVPNDDRSTRATHQAQYGKGGLRRVATIAALDNIPLERREYGMLVFVDSVQSFYQCGPSPALAFGAAPFVPGPSTDTIYANTAAGLAAVGEGEYFYVADADSLTLYRDLSGVATEIGEFPTLATLSAQVSAASGHADDAEAAKVAAEAAQTAAELAETNAAGSEAAATDAAAAAATSAANSQTSALAALAYRDQARAAADAVGPTFFFDTYAAALAAINTITDGAVVQIWADENYDNYRTSYVKTPGLLAYKKSFEGDAIRTDLASTATGKGASLSALKQGGTVQDAIQWVPVLAVGDGTDESAAFQAAHDALPSTGGIMLVPKPQTAFRCQDVRITKSGVTIVGYSREASILPVAGSPLPCFVVTGTNFATRNLRLNSESATGLALILRCALADIQETEFLSRSAGNGTFILLDDYSEDAVFRSGSYSHRILNNQFGRSGFEPKHAITSTASLPITGLTGTFQIGETVTGGTSGATGIVTGRSASRVVMRNITGTWQNAETITGGTSGASATTSSTLTYASMNALVINDNRGICDEPIFLPNGGGNAHQCNTWQSRTGTSGTPAGTAVAFSQWWMSGGNYFERYATVYKGLNNFAAVSGFDHMDNCSNPYFVPFSTTGRLPVMWGTQDGIEQERHRYTPSLFINADSTSIVLHRSAYNISGNGAIRTNCTLSANNAIEGQVCRLYSTTWPVEIEEGTTGNFGPLGSRFTIGQPALPVTSDSSVLYYVELTYLGSRWRVTDYATHEHGCAMQISFSPGASNAQTVDVNSPIINIVASANTTGHLLPNGTAMNQTIEIQYQSQGAFTTAFATAANVLWGSSGAPTFGTGAGQALSITLRWSVINSRWRVVSRVDSA
jgi:hypothetical protein